MALPKSLLLYSTNTYLSYIINRQYYGGQHYVWVSPIFNPESLSSLDPLRNISTTSSPHDLYLGYKKVAEGRDRHGDYLERNRVGIMRGAKLMWDNKVIDEQQFLEIKDKVEQVQLAEFRPLLYLIPSHLVVPRVQQVSVKDAANVLATEYRIFDLKENEFEVLEFKG